MSTTNRIHFDLTSYRLSHGDPRGRGGWAFDFGHGAEFAPGSLLYTEARRWATARALELGVTDVTVLP